MKKIGTMKPVVVAGVDLGDKYSEVCGLDARGDRVVERRAATTKTGLASVFGKLPACRVVIEASGSARWVAELLREMGHEVNNPAASGGVVYSML